MRIFTGRPGSGKTYGAARHLVNEYYDWDPVGQVFDLKLGVRVITNIEGMKGEHISFDREIDGFFADGCKRDEEAERKALADYLSAEVWEARAADGNRWVLVIDEAQRYFPSKGASMPNSVWYFFEYHRHWGVDLVLMTQEASSLNRRVLNVAESFIKAAPVGLRVGSRSLRYTTCDASSGIKIGMTSVKAEEKVFRFYKSAQTEEGNKVPSVTLVQKMAVFLVVLVGLVSGVFWYAKDGFGGGVEHRDVNQVADARPDGAIVSRVGVDESRHGVLTVSEVRGFSAVGVTYDDIRRLPGACVVDFGKVVCPSESMPPVLFAQVQDRICDAGERCKGVFRIREKGPGESVVAL